MVESVIGGEYDYNKPYFCMENKVLKQHVYFVFLAASGWNPCGLASRSGGSRVFPDVNCEKSFFDNFGRFSLYIYNQ